MELVGCPETRATNYQTTLCNIPKEWRSKHSTTSSVTPLWKCQFHRPTLMIAQWSYTMEHYIKEMNQTTFNAFYTKWRLYV